MKNYLFSVLLTIFFLTGGYSQNPGDNVFSGTKVYSVYIQLDQPNYWDSLTYYYSLGTEQYMMGKVTIDGTTIDSIGVRLKGNSSYTHPNNKKSFRLAFGEYNDAQRWDGLKGVHLNNAWGDPTFLREKLFLEFCRDAAIDAPRSNFAQVYLNGVLWGFYSLVEHVDKRLLATHFDDNDGNLYKAVDGIGAASQYVSDFVWYGGDSTFYNMRYEVKTDEPVNPWNDLIRLIDTLNHSLDIATSLPLVFNLNSYYKALAADILFANLDSYAGSGRNFYIYNLPTNNIFQWIVWDAGLAFGGYAGGLTNYETLSLTYVSNGAQRPLIQKIYDTPSLKSNYLQTVCFLKKQFFSLNRFSPRIDTLASLIRPYVYADTKKMFTSQQFEMNLFSDINITGGTGTVRLPGLKSFVSLRSANVLTQLTNLGVTCNIVINPGEVVINEFMAKNDTILDPDGEAEDWIELYNNTNNEVMLDGAYLSDDYTQPAKWQLPANTTIPANGYLLIWADGDTTQTGLHSNFSLSQDGEIIIFSNSNGSLIDSVTFGAQTQNISMARVPNGTGNFTASFPTPGTVNTNPTNIGYMEVVINEFSADNDSIPDPAGETDDWIELYNNSNRTITLSGVYLSDSYTNPVKWQFPAGSTIQPYGYLIVWADQDTLQAGYHALFALSASGERLILSNPDLSLIDSTSYGAQITNRSMARIPNGTGTFVAGFPTFNGPNSPTGVDEEENGQLPSRFMLMQNYPNPFNPNTAIRYKIPEVSKVVLKIYDVLGNEVAIPVNEEQIAGTYEVRFNAGNLASGVYICRLTAGSYSEAKRMILMK
ncbi:MAG: CotH kinase family protein [Ignavibacteriaceae bacterium]